MNTPLKCLAVVFLLMSDKTQRRGFLVLLGLLISPIFTPCAVAEGGLLWPKQPLFLQASQRPFYLYYPSDYQPGAQKKYLLLVVLHGCLQNAEAIAVSTGWNELAEQEKFFVLYPEQPEEIHFLKCWDWYDPDHQSVAEPESEPQIIADMVNKVLEFYPINPQSVFVTGLSAGGGMSQILANCYSDLFAGVAAHSAPSYKSARSKKELWTALTEGSVLPSSDAAQAGWQCRPQRELLPIPSLIIHGSKDRIVTPKLGQDSFLQLLGLNDWLDDGQWNQSVPHIPAAPEQFRLGSVEFKRWWTRQGQIFHERLEVKNHGHYWFKGKSLQKPEQFPSTLWIWAFVQRLRN